jgi:2,4-dienoyl-CoA reductase (NADPH2)
VPGHVVPRELTREEIRHIVVKFGRAACRSIAAGFDGIGLHCAHMYLCGQFLSPWANRREDEYGRDFEGRMRFVLEVVHRIKKETGVAYPLIVRMNGEEQSGGNSLEEIQEIARQLENAGVDAIHVSAGFGTPTKVRGLIPSVTPMRAQAGCIVHLAENIKKVVSIPVIAVNKLGNFFVAEKVLQEGKADLIGIGRSLIADPYLPAKAVDGRFEEIRPCIYCCVGCLGSVLEKGAPVACSVNPMAGREIEGPVGQLEKKKKVLVLGAGPAGMQAAVTAAEKGHEVHLIERTKVLGGQMLLASVPPGKKGIELFRIYLENRLKRSAVTVEFGKSVTSELVDTIKPEVAVLAIGSDPVVPDIEGLSNKKSFTAREILTAQQVEERRILVAGGGQVGCEVAEFLAEHGKEVIIVEILDDVALDMEPINRLALIMSLEDHGVRIMTKTKMESVSDQGVLVNCLGRKEVIPVDAVVFAVGSEPRQDSVEVLIRNKVAEVYSVGDKLRARGILEAIQEGFDVARLI